MTWMVQVYDLTGFMFCYKSFARRDEAEDYATVFKRNKAIIVRVAQ